MKANTFFTIVVGVVLFSLGMFAGKEYQKSLYESRTTVYYSSVGFKRVRVRAPSLNAAEMAISNECQTHGYEVFNVVPGDGHTTYYAECSH